MTPPTHRPPGIGHEFGHLVYVRVFEGCNLTCKHCFIPHTPKRLALDTIAAIPEWVRRFAPSGSKVLLQWHGGEPTVFGAQWLRDAIDVIHERGADIKWAHGIQTNLLTYDEKWRDLYRDHFNGQVGVSWDPDIRLLRGSSQAFEETFWPKLDRLIADALNPYLVITATKPFFTRFRNPFDLFVLLSEHAIQYAHIERLTKTGAAHENWSEIGVDNREYSQGMARLARAYVYWKGQQRQYGQLHLSPFDGLFEAIRSLDSDASGYGCWSGQCDTRFHTIDANGYRPGCTALTADPSLDLGGIPLRQLRAARAAPCHSCRYRKVCSSGCMASPYMDESGECAGGRELFATLENVATQVRS